MESKLINLTGLWKAKSKDGTEFLSGNIGMASVLVFKNNRKRPGSNDPDYNICLAPNERKEPTNKSESEPF